MVPALADQVTPVLNAPVPLTVEVQAEVEPTETLVGEQLAETEETEDVPVGVVMVKEE